MPAHLNGIESAGIDVALDLPQTFNEPGISHGEAQPPAGHIVGFGKGMKFDADFFGAG